MRGLNSVTISGNLTRDSELRATKSGGGVLSFSVAVNDRVKQGNDWVDSPSFIDCTIFGSRAESLGQYLTKGTFVALTGKLRQSSWMGKDGQRRSKVEVIVDEVNFNRPQGGQLQAEQPGAYEDDLPF